MNKGKTAAIAAAAVAGIVAALAATTPKDVSKNTSGKPKPGGGSSRGSGSTVWFNDSSGPDGCD